MKVQFEIEFDENKPQKRSSGGSPKWAAQAQFEANGATYLVFLDIYQKVQKAQPKAEKAAVKVKAS